MKLFPLQEYRRRHHWPTQWRMPRHDNSKIQVETSVLRYDIEIEPSIASLGLESLKRRLEAETILVHFDPQGRGSDAITVRLSATGIIGRFATPEHATSLTPYFESGGRAAAKVEELAGTSGSIRLRIRIAPYWPFGWTILRWVFLLPVAFASGLLAGLLVSIWFAIWNHDAIFFNSRDYFLGRVFECSLGGAFAGFAVVAVVPYMAPKYKRWVTLVVGILFALLCGNRLVSSWNVDDWEQTALVGATCIVATISTVVFFRALVEEEEF